MDNQPSSRQAILSSSRDVFSQSSCFQFSNQNEDSNVDNDNILEVFQLFDLDKDGYLDIFQLQYSFKALGLTASKKDVLHYIHKFTPDAPVGREFISKGNFLKLMRQKLKHRDPEFELQRAFKHFDTENTGKITIISLKKIAEELGRDMSEEELELMIEEFDLDGDNAINYDEFKRIMLLNE